MEGGDGSRVGESVVRGSGIVCVDGTLEDELPKFELATAAASPTCAIPSSSIRMMACLPFAYSLRAWIDLI